MPVTQLYVSVDASTKDSLKRIDRPLFTDFWQRFLDSLKALGEKVKAKKCSDTLIEVNFCFLLFEVQKYQNITQQYICVNLLATLNARYHRN